MVDQTPRTKAWLADLEAIITEIEIKEVPSPRITRKRRRTLKPLWKEWRWSENSCVQRCVAGSSLNRRPRRRGLAGPSPSALPPARSRAASMFPFSKQQSRLSAREALRGCHRNVSLRRSLRSLSPA